MVINAIEENNRVRLRVTVEGLCYRVVREELSEEKRIEPILNAAKGKPCRYLKREHSSRGDKCKDHEVEAYLVCSRNLRRWPVQVEPRQEGWGQAMIRC